MKTIFEKPYVWSFLGQVKGKPTRENMLAELKQVRGEHFIHITEKWNDANQINVQEYKQILSDSIFVPCPSGWGGDRGLKDCFRLYEALEAGSIPIIEKDDFAYFDKFFPGHPFLQIPSDWLGVSNDLESLLGDPKKLQEYNDELIKWWSDYKTNLKSKITEHFQVKNKTNKLAIVIQSCDNYDFLWDGWKHCFLKNWDFSIPAEIYFCTEDKNFVCEGITNIKTGKCETQNVNGASTFSSRMKNAIQQIDADYILYLQEDMWPHQPIDSKLFNDAFQYCIDQDLNVLNFGYKLGANRKFNMNDEIFSIDDFKQYTDTYIGDKQVYNRLCSVDHLKSYNPFSVTHHSCFFKKEFLQKYLCIEGETPIENEVKSSDRIYKDHLNQNAKIQGIDYKWYEHVCEGGKLNEIGKSLTLSKTCFTSIDRNIKIQNKWAVILHKLKSGCNVFAATSNLYSVNKKQTIQQYIDADTDIALCEHNYNAWGCNIESSLSSAYIYIKHSPRTIALIEALHFQLSNIQEDDRFFSYKEQYADHALQKLIESQGGELNVKKIKNDTFAVSEEIYGKNIEHYKSNPPAYINFDRNVYTEELKKVYFDSRITNEAFSYSNKSSEEIVKEFNVKCQLTQNQLIHIIDEIKLRQCNCNILVFGLGHDSIIYDTINHGYTLFIEEDQEWINLNKNITNVLHFNYPTKVKDSIPININKLESYRMPNEIANTNWDIILIDAPAGWALSKSGRSLPIYWSSKLAKKKTVIFVDDQKRELELKYSSYFLNSNKFNSTIYNERDGFGVFKLNESPNTK